MAYTITAAALKDSEELHTRKCNGAMAAINFRDFLLRDGYQAVVITDSNGNPLTRSRLLKNAEMEKQ